MEITKAQYIVSVYLLHNSMTMLKKLSSLTLNFKNFS